MIKEIKRKHWLKLHFREEKDVMVDSDGREYILLDPDLADDGDEPESGDYEQAYLPEYIANEALRLISNDKAQS